MKRITKTICIALSLMLLVNLAGVEAFASESDTVASGKTQKENDTPAADEPDGVGNAGADDAKKDDGTNADPGVGDANTSGEDDLLEADKNNSADDNGMSVDADLDAENPAQEDNTDEAEQPLDTQNIADLKAEPVAGKNELKVSWAVSGSFKIETFKETGTTGTPEKEVTVSGTTGTVEVTPGIPYMIRVSNTVETSQVGEIPAILLAAPTNLKAAVSNGAVTLNWSAVAGAASYKVLYNGQEKVVTSPSCTVNGLDNGTKYDLSVIAQTELNKSGTKYLYSSAAAEISVTPAGNRPSQVTGFSGIDGEKSAILTWSKAAYADSYAVYRYNSSKNVWEVVKSGLSKLTYTDKKLKEGKTYKYRVAGVNVNGTGKLSSTIKISVKKSPGTKVRSIGYKAVLKSRAPLFGTSKSSKRLKYLNAGKSVTTVDYANARYAIQIGGKTYWLSKDRLKFKDSIWTTKDYSTKVKEDFVNRRGYKSPSKYLIWISHYTQRVVIYQGSKGKWKMIRSAKCATGTHLHMTPKGKFAVGKKEKGWFYRSTFEKPIVHFKGQNSFHSRIKNYKGGYADATIGRPRSKGCVRLYDEDINFIYKKCPKGTTVISL